MNLFDAINNGEFELIKEKMDKKKISRKLVVSSMVDVFFKDDTVNSLFSMLIMSYIDVLNQRSEGFAILGIDRFAVVDCLMKKEFYEFSYDRYFEELVECCVDNNDFEAIDYLLKSKSLTYSRRDRTNVVKQSIFAFGKVEAYQYLKKKNLVIKCVVKRDFTPLMSSIRKGDLILFRYLVDSGVDVNEQGCDKLTPFLLSAMYGKYKIASYLLSLGANPHAVDSMGRNAIYHSCKSGSVEVLDLLFQAGVEVLPENFKDENINQFNEEALMYVNRVVAQKNRAKELSKRLLTK